LQRSPSLPSSLRRWRRGRSGESPARVFVQLGLVQLGLVWVKAPQCIVYASRGAVEDSGAQGGQGVQATADREHFLWRIDQFEQLGFSEAEASQLAESDADLGQARHLLATGCSLTLALKILL
jgi:hypothetical protein